MDRQRNNSSSSGISSEGNSSVADFRGADADDLTKIRGIGPATNEFLRSIGIRSFTELATTNIDELASAISSQGERFKTAKPAEWARQADEILQQLRTS